MTRKPFTIDAESELPFSEAVSIVGDQGGKVGLRPSVEDPLILLRRVFGTVSLLSISGSILPCPLVFASCHIAKAYRRICR